jgi:hypothetical protein
VRSNACIALSFCVCALLNVQLDPCIDGYHLRLATASANLSHPMRLSRLDTTFMVAAQVSICAMTLVTAATLSPMLYRRCIRPERPINTRMKHTSVEATMHFHRVPTGARCVATDCVALSTDAALSSDGMPRLAGRTRCRLKRARHHCCCRLLHDGALQSLKRLWLPL